jgi:hypothetical protein
MRRLKTADRPNAQASLQFSGTGVAILGDYLDAGGKADVLLDGKKAGEIDAQTVPHTNDNVYWHVTGLTPGPHTVQVRLRADSARPGGVIAIERAVVYGK